MRNDEMTELALAIGILTPDANLRGLFESDLQEYAEAIVGPPKCDPEVVTAELEQLRRRLRELEERSTAIQREARVWPTWQVGTSCIALTTIAVVLLARDIASAVVVLAIGAFFFVNAMSLQRKVRAAAIQREADELKRAVCQLEALAAREYARRARRDRLVALRLNQLESWSQLGRSLVREGRVCEAMK